MSAVKRSMSSGSVRSRVWFRSKICRLVSPEMVSGSAASTLTAASSVRSAPVQGLGFGFRVQGVERAQLSTFEFRGFRVYGAMHGQSRTERQSRV